MRTRRYLPQGLNWTVCAFFDRQEAEKKKERNGDAGQAQPRARLGKREEGRENKKKQRFKHRDEREHDP